MRILNIAGRLHIERGDDLAIDVATASAGRFSPDPQAIYARWAEFTQWSQSLGQDAATVPIRGEIGPPAPRPAQVFAVGLNYSAHADESGFAKPESPVIFTKFASSITGPVTSVVLPPGNVDWEVELVAVIGQGGRNIAASRAWDHIAGLTVGQDISERARQHSGPAPQFSLAKSHEGFSPTGPVLVTVDEFGDVDDLGISATINGEIVQRGRTSQLIFPIPHLVAELSSVVELLPGDLIFTGTPSGVGAGMVPPRYLAAGDVLRSRIDDIGELVQTFVEASQTLVKADRRFVAI